MSKHHTRAAYSHMQKFGLIFGLIGLITPLIISAPQGLSIQGWRLIGMETLMASWWIFSVIEIDITALIPIIALPLLKINSAKAAAAPFGSPVVFLLLGGFLLATALEKWHVHQRIALYVATHCGKKIDRIILGFMITVACISMWISNTAATLIMLTIASALIDTIGQKHQLEPKDNTIGTAMMLGIAYAASIGGMGTIVGTAPNAFLVEFLSQPPYLIQLSFLKWMMIAIPCTIILIPITWLILTRIVFRACSNPTFHMLQKSQQTLEKQLKAMGPMASAEKRTCLLFLTIAMCWTARPFLNSLPQLTALNDAAISILGAIMLFLIPSNTTHTQNSTRLLTWQDTANLPWGVLILLGGGLSLASAVSQTDLAYWIGTKLSLLENLPTQTVIFLFSTTISLLTEMTSNTATTATFIPILTAFAVKNGIDPLLIAMPATLTASCAFMLPIATPPNTLIFSTPYVTIPKMVKAGIAVNIIAVIIICTISTWIITLLN